MVKVLLKDLSVVGTQLVRRARDFFARYLLMSCCFFFQRLSKYM